METDEEMRRRLRREIAREEKMERKITTAAERSFLDWLASNKHFGWLAPDMKKGVFSGWFRRHMKRRD